MSRFSVIMLWCWGVGVLYGQCPPIRGDFLWWKYILFWDPPGYVFDHFFFRKLDCKGVFLEGVQKYFEKVEMMWSNFQKARDARATRART